MTVYLIDSFMLLGVFTFYLYVCILFERKYLVITLGIIWQFNFTLQFYTFDSVCIWVLILISFLLIVFLFGWSVRDGSMGWNIKKIVNVYAVIEYIELISLRWKRMKNLRVGRVAEQVDDH